MTTLHPDDPHDRRLAALVHPADWSPPSPQAKYHLAVLGGGTAGLGARVALIECDLLGGDCLNSGCVPSKALLAAARTGAAARDAHLLGVRVGAVAVDFAGLMERMRRLRAGLAPHDSAERFRGLGVDVFFGEGRFTAPDRIEVGGQTLRFHRAVIATGSRPALPPVPGLEEAGFLTNETVFALTALPPRLLVLGAGPVGCELAQAFARFGSRVTLAHTGERILSREDADLSGVVRHALLKDGVTVLPDATALSARQAPEGKVVRVRRGGREEDVVADEILVAVGRTPRVEGLGLEAAGVRFDAENGVTVDDRLRTTNRRVFAAGDVCTRRRFTHAADAMARVVVQNALFWGRARVSALTIPWCTYTAPELARVGLSEDEARARGVPYRLFTQPLSGVDRAVLDGRTDGLVKVLAHPRTDRILGVGIVAAGAGELIGEATLAMTAGLGLRALAATVHPYPTTAEAFRKLGDAYNRTRLTPLVRRLLGAWLRWFA